MAAHAYWRIRITAVIDGGSAFYVTTDEVEMRTAIGGASVCTGGSPIASSEVTFGDGNGPATKAFDGDIATYWMSQFGPPQWIGYQFAAPVEIVEIAIHDPAADGGNPVDFALERSDDGSAWVAASNWSGVSWPSAGWQVFAVDPAANEATPAGTPRRPAGALAAAYYPPRYATPAGTPRRPAGAILAAHAFSVPAHVLRTSYTLTLTGTADGLPDLALALASWQATARLIASTYLSCVVPFAPATEAAILARPHGTLIVRQHLHYTDRTLSADLVVAPWDGAPRIDVGARSASITLAGYAQQARAPKSIPVRGVSYRRSDESGVTVRCAIDLLAAPGDTLDYGDGTLLAEQITYICSVGAEWMEARADG